MPESVLSALSGEFGAIRNPMGGFSTEVSITVNDPRLNQGRATNIPTLVRGNEKNIDRIFQSMMTGRSFPREVVDIAIARAQARVREGQQLPSFRTIEEAVKAAIARSENKMIFGR